MITFLEWLRLQEIGFNSDDDNADWWKQGGGNDDDEEQPQQPQHSRGALPFPKDPSQVREPRKTAGIHVRWFIRRDLPEVLEIVKKQRLAQGRDPELDQFEQQILELMRRNDIIGMIVERGEMLVGYMLYELNKGHIRLVKLATLHGEQSVIEIMLAKLVDKLSQYRRKSFYLDVKDNFTPKVGRWLNSMGFYGEPMPDGSIRFTYHIDNRSDQYNNQSPNVNIVDDDDDD